MGRPRKNNLAPPEKPMHLVRVTAQKCHACDQTQTVGAEVIVHLVNPVIFCKPCAGEKVDTNPFLSKGIVVQE
jgi:hypothetical protein